LNSVSQQAAGPIVLDMVAAIVREQGFLGAMAPSATATTAST